MGEDPATACEPRNLFPSGACVEQNDVTTRDWKPHDCVADAHRDLFQPLFGSLRWRLYLTCHAVLVVVFCWQFWVWWCTREASGQPLVTLLFLCCQLHEWFGAIYASFLLLRAVQLKPDLPLPKLRVAMITTKVPSEPLELLQKTLTGMLTQDYPYPYDVWLADERPDEETREWCKQHGVNISCRYGIDAYHRQEWPRRTRCKEGNLAYFYDHWGYRDYDVVCQFDADHVPNRDYLISLLPAFSDPKVGYAAMPSICGANKEESWAVRGRLFEQAAFHGVSGCGRSYDWMPNCIGSHYAVRTSAVRKAGGIGPELDEDFSTSYMLNSAGYKGLFSINTIAHGLGPSCFEDAMRQEYQWARSAMVLMIKYTRPYWAKLSWKAKIVLTYCYSAWIMRAVGILYELVILVAAAMAPRATWVNFGPSVAARMIPLKVLMIVQLICLNKSGKLRPEDAELFSWEAATHVSAVRFHSTKGAIHGILGATLGWQFNIKVTPKDSVGGRLMPFSCISPYLFMALVAMALGTLRTCSMMHFGAASHYIFMAWVVTLLHCKENYGGLVRRVPRALAITVLVPLGVATGLLLLLFTHGHGGCVVRSGLMSPWMEALEVGEGYVLVDVWYRLFWTYNTAWSLVYLYKTCRTWGRSDKGKLH